MIPQFLVGAANSGSGKTTLTLGLLRALRRRGLSVGAAKCGPDYIDTGFHRLASGSPSVNLDLFMSSPERVAGEYARAAAGRDAMIVEGVMGLFDGYHRSSGSAAEIASTLRLKVVLVVNAASTAYSVAATIYGFKNFSPDVDVVGVVFNRVASGSHFAFLKDACADAGVECLGYLQRNENLSMPSRHLGLSIGDEEAMESFINAAADEVEANVDIDRLLSLTSADTPSVAPDPVTTDLEGMRIGVANDEAFSFIYPANINALSRRGAEIRFFSPLSDAAIPSGCGMIYLPGGYPELYADRLSRNLSMRRSVADYCNSGGRVLAECGGMIYLTRDIDGIEMCGVIDASATMDGARLRLGYRRVEVGGCGFRGHEFHYSRLKDCGPMENVARQFDARGKEVDTRLFRTGNVIAGYTHLYWPDNDIMKLWQ